MKRALLTLGVLLALPYACAPVYRFPAAIPFTGDRFFNPYERITGTWQRANLHAHGRAWLGLTNGRQPNEEVVRRYRALGYSVPGVSNYHQIAAHDGLDTIPAYEHGYNIRKHHQLAIGARRVDWLDFPIWQSRSHLQYIIHRVAGSAELVALVHPESRNAYDADDLRRLTGYHLMEVVNGKFPHEAAWDAALSSGHAVWGIGNDDNHNLDDRERLGVAWTMIDAASAEHRHILEALRVGRAYAVLRTNEAAPDTLLDRVTVEGSTLTVSAAGAPSEFSFIGQDGAIRKTVPRALTASYELQPADTYVRTTIRGPRTTMYLNPVVRYDGRQLPWPRATVDSGRTWMVRGAIGAIALGAAVALRRRRVRGAAVIVVLTASPAAAQTLSEPESLVTIYDGTILDDLPLADSVFAVLETLEPTLVADRFTSGGVSAAEGSSVGGLLSSPRQTTYRIGPVGITDPAGSGLPLLLPDLLFWERVTVATGLLPPEISGTGASI